MHLSIDELRNTKVLDSNYIKYAIDNALVDGCYLEFGVFKGNSVNHIADLISPKVITGFDSFVGLPEEWVMGSNENRPKGYFSCNGSLPKVKDNVILVKGFFEESLPKWLELNNQKIAFLHIDSDLYSSAKCILNYLNCLIIPGTVIVFDDMFSWKDESIYPNWREGEFKAMNEWFEQCNRSAVVLSRQIRWSSTIMVTE